MNTTVQLITVNGRKFATGLLWQLLTKPRAYMQEAREIGGRENMDVVAIRRGRVLQAGLAHKSSVSPGTYSLASSLAGILGDDWIGVFEIDATTDQYVIVGVNKNGAIIPGCDYAGPRDDVFERLRSDNNLHQFGRVICPDDFDFGGEELRLPNVLSPQKLKPEYKLRPLVGGLSGRQWVRLGLIFLVVMLLAGGAMFYIAHKKEEEQKAADAAAAAEALQLQALQAATGKEATPVALTHPWAMQPGARITRETCVAGLSRVPISIGGWMVETATCISGNVQATYRRERTATVNTLTSTATDLGYQVSNMDEAGDTATISWAAAALVPGGDDPLQDIAAIANTVRSTLQGRQVSYTFTPAPAPAPPTPADGQAPADPAQAVPVPDWKTYNLSITGKRNPEELLAGIEDLPTMRVQTVAVRRNGSELEWSLTGDIHGK